MGVIEDESGRAVVEIQALRRPLLAGLPQYLTRHPDKDHGGGKQSKENTAHRIQSTTYSDWYRLDEAPRHDLDGPRFSNMVQKPA